MVSLDNLKTTINAIKCLLADYPKKKDIPTKLPNPNPLTFTGASTASYYGSEALTVEIPSVPKPLAYDYMPEGYPRKTMGTVTLLEEQELEFTTENDTLYTAVLTYGFKIVKGKTYTVNWDGAEYECVGSIFNRRILFLGNLSIIGEGDDTGEPFLYSSFSPTRSEFDTLDTSPTHTISIKTIGEIATPMAEEFLPESLATNSDVEVVQTAADNAKAAADAALANFPVKYTDVVDTPFSAIGLPGEVTTYLRSSVRDGAFINLYLVAGTQFTGSGFYKISSDVFDFEDIYKISYKNKYDSGNSSSLISIDNLEQNVRFSHSDHSVFAIGSGILFCGSTGEFEITAYGTKTMSFYVEETGIYSISDYKSMSYSFVNYIELTKKESVFIQSSKPVLIPSSTEGSTKKFKITVDDSGIPSVINTGDSVEVWSGATHSAYAAAQAGGYTDTQANFYADLAAVQGLASALAAI